MADHGKPTLTSNYSTQLIQELDGRLDDLAVGMDPARTTATNFATWSLRWNSANGYWEQYNGSAWVSMASIYNISISGNAATATTAASATDASTLTGMAPAANGTAGAANKIARVSSDGYMYLSYVNSNTTNGENYSTLGNFVYTVGGSDHFYRKATPTFAAAAIQSVASGSWNITASGANLQAFNAPAANANTSFSNTPVSTTSFTQEGAASNAPGGTWWFMENQRHSNATNIWGRQNAWGWEDNANEFYSRNVSNGTWGSWVRFLHSGNFNAIGQASGSGNWPIYASSGAQDIASVDGGVAYRDVPTYAARNAMATAAQYGKGLRWEFKTQGAIGVGSGNYAGLLTLAPYSGTTAGTGDPSYQLVFQPAGVNSTAKPTARIRAGLDSTWGSWATVVTDDNIASYVSGGFSNMVVFSSSGSWTVPAGITKCKVTVVGAGGSGHPGFGSCCVYGGGNGGAGGGSAIKVCSGLTPGASITVTVGVANGNTSSFAAPGGTVSATGGANATAYYTQAAGGIGSGGDLNLRGLPGGNACPGTNGGPGGASSLGGGGQGYAYLSTIVGTSGQDGGGGGGGYATVGGYNGGNGKVIVEY